MKIDLTADEAQHLLDGINDVIEEKAREIAYLSEALTLGPNRDKILAELRVELDVAKSARRKVQAVA